MEKKSALIGGGIGLAVGMAAMFGIVMGIGSCASFQSVKKLNPDSVLVQRPKMADGDDVEYYHVYKLDTFSGKRVAGSIVDTWRSLDLGTGYYKGFVGGSNKLFVGSTTTSASGTLSISITGDSGTGEPVQFTYSGGDYSGSGSLWYLAYDNYTGSALNLLDTVYPERQEGWISIEGTNITFTDVNPNPYTGNLVTEIFEQVGESLSNFALALGDSVGQAVALFYDGNGFTPLGILTLVSGGIALVYWTFYLIKKMLNIGVK